ncbi:MAG: hypothetical protein ACRCSN_01835, partial [Dermatophilaceae bacterium]
PLSMTASAKVISGPSMGPPFRVMFALAHRRCARAVPSVGAVSRPIQMSLFSLSLFRCGCSVVMEQWRASRCGEVRAMVRERHPPAVVPLFSREKGGPHG